MQRLTKAARQFLSTRVRAIAMVCLAGLLSLLSFANQPAYADDSNRNFSQTPQERNNSIAEKRVDAYEDALDVVNDPRGEQKEYQENLKEYQEENSNQGGLIEDAKEAIEKIIPGK
ncbi:MAG TPA: hypothetical protein V6D29_15095 [Leptolyngbyaceae cyanobacterium]